MELRSEALSDLDGVCVRPARDGNGTRTGVLVLSGSSGRVETERAAVLAGLGTTALTYRWFGSPGQPSGIWELPLESFDRAVGRLASHCDRVVLVGVSKSAEAFLLYAADDPRVDAVVAMSPSHVVWANVAPGPDGALRPQHSSWSRAGRAVPFVPYDDDVAVTGDPPAFEPVYRASLATHADRVAAATIPVERFFGDVLLVAGGDDQVWPSLESARRIEARRTAYALPTTLVTHPHAGHRVVLPGETVATGGLRMARGGSEASDRALGRLAWPEIRRVLGTPEG
jgi:dienelactone hydrolase